MYSNTSRNVNKFLGNEKNKEFKQQICRSIATIRAESGRTCIVAFPAWLCRLSPFGLRRFIAVPVIKSRQFVKTCPRNLKSAQSEHDEYEYKVYIWKIQFLSVRIPWKKNFSEHVRFKDDEFKRKYHKTFNESVGTVKSKAFVSLFCVICSLLFCYSFCLLYWFCSTFHFLVKKDIRLVFLI